jgi:two-component system, chemotaxis family, protein-glutamate methylesterase/glutaminase
VRRARGECCIHPTPEVVVSRGIVVIAASAGGFQPLLDLLRELPRDFPLPVAVVLHRPALRTSAILVSILQRRTALPVREARQGEVLQPSTVYVAPAHLHLVVDDDGTFDFRDGRRERHLLSSANPLLRSASSVLGPGVIAVVLSGCGFDATDGVQQVRERGGIVIAQDPADARHASMPRSAIATGSVSHVLPLAEIAPMLVRLTAAGVAPAAATLQMGR